MKDRVHVKAGVIVKKYEGERGKIVLANGDIVAPLVIGLEVDDHKILPIEYVIDDTSTAHPPEYENIVETLEADRLLFEIERRDKTAAEKQAEKDEELADDGAKLDKVLLAEGSIERAIIELLFEDRNKMAQAIADATSLASVKTAFPPVYDRSQFVDALRNKMRDK